MTKNRSLLWYSALAVGWAFDILYWKKPLGVSFAIHILLLLGLLYYLSFREEKKPSSWSFPLAGLAILFSVLGFLRAEPFTRTLNHLLSLGFVSLLILSFQGGRWTSYTLSDYIVGAFRLFTSAVGLPLKLISEAREENEAKEQEDTNISGLRKAAPYIRGILLAMPVLVVLGALLAEADPIFSEWLNDLIELLRLEKLPEYILRLVLISIWTFITAGLLLHALIKSKKEKLVGQEQPWPPRFLGSTETTIIMGAVNLLFFAFVSIQFQYFFGGEKNISLDGYTYSEYARRGFGELLTVAFFTLFIIMVLSGITRRETKRDRRVFTLMTGLMTGFIGVILISSLQRLALYEAAYGFTRLRTYSHICILWIGALFLAIFLLEVSGQHRFFTLATVTAVAGFVLTLNAVNVDGFITTQNVKRLEDPDNALDTYHLNSLSADAIPYLIEYADSSLLSSDDEDVITAILACRADGYEDDERGWLSFLLPVYRGKKLLMENDSLWKDVQFEEDEWGGKYIPLNGEDFYCWGNYWD